MASCASIGIFTHTPAVCGYVGLYELLKTFSLCVRFWFPPAGLVPPLRHRPARPRRWRRFRYQDSLVPSPAVSSGRPLPPPAGHSDGTVTSIVKCQPAPLTHHLGIVMPAPRASPPCRPRAALPGASGSAAFPCPRPRRALAVTCGTRQPPRPSPSGSAPEPCSRAGAECQCAAASASPTASPHVRPTASPP